MSQSTKNVRLYRCPACFARDIDFFLNYDKKDEEYYCTKCCYVGKEVNIKSFYDTYLKEKYKAL